MTKKKINWHDVVEEVNPEAMLADGLEDAIIGYVTRWNGDPVIVYDAEKCIKILMKQGMGTYEEAAEFFEYNTAGAYVGENTPLFLRKFDV